jgi:amidase
MVAVAHGNDGMGSIRIPAACCGLVGIKPGRGVVPSDIGNGSWFGMAENGPLATTVDDCALLLSVMADRPVLATIPDAGRLRIAVSTHAPAPFTPVDRQWGAAARETGALLQANGHRVTSARPPYGQLTAFSEIVRWVAGTELDARLLADPSELEPRTRRHAQLGRAALRLGLPRERGRSRWQAAAERFFADYDVLVTPALAQSPIEAAAWGQRSWLANVMANVRYAPFAAPWNLAGWPAMVVPAGLHTNGMPMSVQLVAPPGWEGLLLSIARQLETLRPWPRTAPPGA